MKFFAVYVAPASVIDEWMKKEPHERKDAEDKMRADWNAWEAEHKAQIIETVGVGKTKRATTKGISDTKNDLMLYSIVEAPSHDAAAEIFKKHPHLQIPESAIDIMPMNPLKG
jgi:hypothetical protein